MKALLRSGLLVLLSSTLSLILAEGVLRTIDRFEIDSLTLRRSIVVDDPLDDPLLPLAGDYVADLPVARGVDRAWFFENPPALPREEPLPEMRRRYLASGKPSREAIYSHNRAWATERLCRRDYILDPWLGDSLPDRYLFDPTPDPERQVRYRFPAGQTTPDGRVVNRWGFQGREVPLDRPEGTIRLAFAGASTTANHPSFAFSYPDYVEFFLDRWAQAKGLDVDFDILNAGRPGFRSSEIAAVVRYEVLPFDPDFVVYYEGSNQFFPRQYVEFQGGRPPSPPKLTSSGEGRRHSALVRRLEDLAWRFREAREPNKPGYSVHWPEDIDEMNPDLRERARFPSELGTILDDLEDIRRRVDAEGAELVVSTFVWLVEDGMELSFPRDRTLYLFLNETFYPFTYAHLRRYADFQNRVLAEYARQNALELLDLDAALPKDPRLFKDAVHMREAGIRLRSWVTAQWLIPILERRLEEGTLPRPSRAEPLVRHPALWEPPELVTLEEIRSACP